MNKEWVLTQESFDALLAWLDPNRELAGRKYEDIRTRLVKIFSCRGCYEPEDLADETINRVTSKLKDIESSFIGERARYFYGVANKVHLEYLRRKPYRSLRCVSCSIAGDVLILTGSVETYYLKQIAQEAVGKLGGIREIRNLIVVRTS